MVQPAFWHHNLPLMSQSLTADLYQLTAGYHEIYLLIATILKCQQACTALQHGMQGEIKETMKDET